MHLILVSHAWKKICCQVDRLTKAQFQGHGHHYEDGCLPTPHCHLLTGAWHFCTWHRAVSWSPHALHLPLPYETWDSTTSKLYLWIFSIYIYACKSSSHQTGRLEVLKRILCPAIPSGKRHPLKVLKLDDFLPFRITSMGIYLTRPLWTGKQKTHDGFPWDERDIYPQLHERSMEKLKSELPKIPATHIWRCSNLRNSWFLYPQVGSVPTKPGMLKPSMIFLGCWIMDILIMGYQKKYTTV